MDASHHALLTLGIALTAGVLGQVLARHIRVPAILLLLVLGAVLGPDVLGWVHPSSLGDGLFALVEIGVAIILFEGGLNLQPSRLRRQERPIRYLVTFGAIVTLAGAFVAAFSIMEWNWKISLLFGSLVVVTGPTVVTPLLRDMRLRPRIKTILEAEGVLIDPIGAILAALVLQIVLAPISAGTIGREFLLLAARIGFGVVAGIIGGFLIGGALKIRRVIPSGLENIFALAVVILLFTACEAVISASGIMAVTVAGIVVGWMGTLVDRELREFKDQLTLLLIGLLFILLAADTPLEGLRSLGMRGIMVVLALVAVVRPLGAWVSTGGSGLSRQERTFIGWVAPRGIVAAAIASLTADTLNRSGIEGAAELRSLVFLTIGTTVILAGVTARPIASFLKIRLPGRDRVAILGVGGLALAMADELHRKGTEVVFLDSDPKRCRLVEDREFAVVFGDALKERTMQRARFDLVGTAIGMTPNDHLNSLFAGQAQELFDVPLGLVALPSTSAGKLPEHVILHGAAMLFEGPHDVARWEVRFRRGDVKIARFLYSPIKKKKDEEPIDPDPRNANPAERFVALTFLRGSKAVPMRAGMKFKKEDVFSAAVNESDFDAVVHDLARLEWELFDE